MAAVRLAGALALATFALAGCEDPKPGLQDEQRVEKVIDCKAVVGHFAPTERKKDQLCECLTGRLAQQQLTVDDLRGAKRDRAMEQLRWCGQQVGLFGKSTPAAPKPSPGEPDVETPGDAEPIMDEPAPAEAAPAE